MDDGGARLTVANTANVADSPIVLTGSSIRRPTAASPDTDAITNVTQPDFFGNSEPFSHVTLFATLRAAGRPSRSARSRPAATARGTSSRASPWPTASYSITATAIDQFGVTTTTAADRRSRPTC